MIDLGSYKGKLHGLFLSADLKAWSGIILKAFAAADIQCLPNSGGK